ncbi:NAD(P)-binding domain-containing protein [Paraburkholderia rhynchosiae]|nr:NAD(P)-binding domain-containing protein [Paraburkholderia rhynchosiae]
MVRAGQNRLCQQHRDRYHEYWNHRDRLIGGTLTRRLSKLGHKVFVANSRGPASLVELAAETGATAVIVHEASRSGESFSSPYRNRRFPICRKEPLRRCQPRCRRPGNYYPRERDGRIDAIEDGMAESRWVANQLGRPVLKAINTLHWRSLLDEGKPARARPHRIAGRW